MKPRDKASSLLRHYLRFVWFLLAIAAVPLLLLRGCQSQFIYLPRPYGEGITAQWQQRTAGKKIDFTTSQGKQRAFLQGNLKTPRNLWIFCGGNGTVALDWSEWIAENAPQEDAWLLVDFPGTAIAKDRQALRGFANPSKKWCRSLPANSVGAIRRTRRACGFSATASAAPPA